MRRISEFELRLTSTSVGDASLVNEEVVGRPPVGRIWLREPELGGDQEEAFVREWVLTGARQQLRMRADDVLELLLGDVVLGAKLDERIRRARGIGPLEEEGPRSSVRLPLYGVLRNDTPAQV